MLDHIAEVEETKVLLVQATKHYEKCFQAACAENCELIDKVKMLSHAAQVMSPMSCLPHAKT